MAAMRQGKNCETTFVTKNGVSIPVLIAGSIIRDAEGHELGSIGFAKDLREIRRHDQLATLGEVAIGLEHEHNSPLEVTGNNLNLREAHMARVPSDEDFVVEGERLDSIHAALTRIQRIVTQLIEMAHGSEYATREYLPGAQMTDLRAAGAGTDGGRAAALAPHDPALTGIRILVVDDDLGVCQSLRDLLTQEGCEVLVATGGREGLARLAPSYRRRTSAPSTASPCPRSASGPTSARRTTRPIAATGRRSSTPPTWAATCSTPPSTTARSGASASSARPWSPSSAKAASRASSSWCAPRAVTSPSTACRSILPSTCATPTCVPASSSPRTWWAGGTRCRRATSRTSSGEASATWASPRSTSTTCTTPRRSSAAFPARRSWPASAPRSRCSSARSRPAVSDATASPPGTASAPGPTRASTSRSPRWCARRRRSRATGTTSR